MLDMEELKKLGEEAGFTHVSALDCSTIKLLPEVRQMCASNTCHMYGKNWHCPPGCGTLEECEARVPPLSLGDPGADSRKTGGFYGRGGHDGDGKSPQGTFF